MEKYFEILTGCLLFAGVERADLKDMIDQMGGIIKTFSKDEPILLEGDPAKYLGIVLSGSGQVTRDDHYGNRSVLTMIDPGELFAEVFFCAGLKAMPVSVIATAECTVLLLECEKALKNDVIANNLLREMARKTMALNQKIKYMSQKTTKEKLMLFLSDQASQHGNNEFIIPYNRQELADYLGVERSAMSAEIGKLKKSGVIDTKGSWFRLLT
jgi:CRP-like cAMP-binding protein